MPSNRCQVIVLDQETKRNRLCKKNKKFVNICTCHALMYIIKVQAFYKGFYVRRKLKIFNNLPRDIQRLIIYHINEEIYTRRFNSSISKLLDNKLNTFFNNPDYIIFINSYITFDNYYKNNSIEANEFVIELFYILRLIKKYELLINKAIHLTNFIKIYKICYYCWLKKKDPYETYIHFYNISKQSPEYKILNDFCNYVAPIGLYMHTNVM